MPANVKLEVRRLGIDDDNDEQGRSRPASSARPARWQVEFRNDDDYNPAAETPRSTSSRSPGSGEWDGKVGYTFEMKAIDDGEPGRGPGSVQDRDA